jgi:hypothetical protein
LKSQSDRQAWLAPALEIERAQASRKINGNPRHRTRVSPDFDGEVGANVNASFGHSSPFIFPYETNA